MLQITESAKAAEKGHLPEGGVEGRGGLWVTGRLVGVEPQYIFLACSMSFGLSPRVLPSFVLPSLRVIVIRPFPKAVEW